MLDAKRAAMPKPPEPEPVAPSPIPRVRSSRLFLESESEERRKSREREAVWSSLVTARGTRYEKCRLDNFQCEHDGQRLAVGLLKDYADNAVEKIGDGVNVVLIGPAGTGKDHLLFALCHAAIGAYRRVEWVNGTSLWMKFRSVIGDDDKDELSIIRELVRPDVLAISDPVPPRGPLTDYQASMLFDAVDARYSNRKPVWVTLNCANRAEAEERMGVQVVDRIAHDALIVPCNWPSFRKA